MPARPTRAQGASSPATARPLAALLLSAILSACGREPAADGPLPIADQGRAAYAACAVCHSKEDPSAPGYVALVGPSLFGVYGAKSAHHGDYDYSKAMREANLVWDDATLDAFIANPHLVVPKSRMSFAGEPDAARRAALVAYLKTLK